MNKFNQLDIQHNRYIYTQYEHVLMGYYVIDYYTQTHNIPIYILQHICTIHAQQLMIFTCYSCYCHSIDIQCARVIYCYTLKTSVAAIIFTEFRLFPSTFFVDFLL